MSREIKVRYDDLEDRIQVTFWVAGRLHHLLLTRRVWSAARMSMQRMLDLSAEVPASLPRSMRESISAAHHHAVASQTQSAVGPALERGVPEDAVLVTHLRIGQRKRKGEADAPADWVLIFKVHGRADLRLVLGDKLMHALVGALMRRELSANWGLPTLPARSALAQGGKPTLQ